MWPLKIRLCELIMTPAEVLQGGYHMEKPSAPERVASAGSEDGQ